MLYSVKDAARLLSVSVRTISRGMDSGKLKCCRIGSSIRFTRNDLEAFAGRPLFNDEEVKAPPSENRGIIPPDIIKTLESEIEGISHGTVSLVIHIRDSRPRFVVGRERSFLPETEEA